MNYRPEIDGLRCLAVLLVFVFHFEVFAIGKAGFVGVDVFYVISGFLISSIIWGQLEAGRFTLRGFYLRRFRRLAPALICVQLLLIGTSYLLLLPQEARDLAAQNVTAQAYIINLYLWRHVSYFGIRSDSVMLLHCWSLAIEEQFYLLYPLLLMLVHRYARRRLGWVLASLATASFLLNLVFVQRKPEATFYLLPTRAWELLLGALLPFVQPWFESRARARQLAAAVGVLLIVGALVFYHPGIAFPGTFDLLPTVGTAVLLLATAGEGSWVSLVLRRKPVVYIGTISYSMYLVHWPIKVLASYFLPSYTLGWRWASVGLALSLSVAVYHGVENPIRKGTFLAKPRRFVTLYAAGFASVVLLASSALATDGWRSRFGPEVLRLVDATLDRDESARVCEYRKGAWPSPSGPCHIGAAGVPATWAVVGDSHAWALEKAFSLFLEERHEGGMLAFAHACLPVLDLGNPSCLSFTADVVHFIEGDREIRNVVLVSIWRQPLEGIETSDGGFVEGRSALYLFVNQFGRMLRRLKDAGKNIYVWEPVPVARMNVPRTLARNLAFGMHLEVAADRAEHERLFKFMNDALISNRQLVRGIISPSSVMCPTSACMVEQDGSPLFFDNNHPAFSQAPFYAHIIEQQLRVMN